MAFLAASRELHWPAYWLERGRYRKINFPYVVFRPPVAVLSTNPPNSESAPAASYTVNFRTASSASLHNSYNHSPAASAHHSALCDDVVQCVSLQGYFWSGGGRMGHRAAAAGRGAGARITKRPTDRGMYEYEPQVKWI